VTTAAGAHDQQLVLYYPASVSRAFLVGLLAMPRFASRECLHKSIVINLIRADNPSQQTQCTDKPRQRLSGRKSAGVDWQRPRESQWAGNMLLGHG
jgi:hypothetical protein